MKTLREQLQEFDGSGFDESQLTEKFKELSKAFLYGGFINVDNKFKVFIKTVEFYFHSELDGGVKDPIVYHRNGNCLDEVPYFPLMTLHAHNSGFDITFENQQKQYRASALIREYEIVDAQGKYLKWVNVGEISMFRQYDDYQFNTQSTYLYFILNGFCMGYGASIRWEDKFRIQNCDLTEKCRKNVFKSKSDTGYIKGEKCVRKWSFSRNEKV